MFTWGGQDFAPDVIAGGMPRRKGWKTITEFWNMLGTISTGYPQVGMYPGQPQPQPMPKPQKATYPYPVQNTYQPRRPAMYDSGSDGPPMQPPAAQMQQPSPPPANKFCTSCGAAIHEEGGFCQQCGSLIDWLGPATSANRQIRQCSAQHRGDDEDCRSAQHHDDKSHHDQSQPWRL